MTLTTACTVGSPHDQTNSSWLPDWEAIEGNDVCGHIEAVGKNVSGFSKGDKVAAFSKMATGNQYGA